MITAKEVLNSLCEDGLIFSWRRHTEGRAYRWTDYVVSSPCITVENETLGNRSFLYFYCTRKDIIPILMDSLKQNGCNPNVCVNGGPNKNAHIEIQVSKFKGYNWWY